MLTELLNAHPDELQVWAVRTSAPWGRGVRAWAGFALSLAIRGFTFGHYGGRYSHVLFRRGDTTWESTARGVRDGEASRYNRKHLVVDAYHVNCHLGDAGIIIAWLSEQRGRGYDFPQLLGIALDIIGKAEWLAPMLNSNDRLICSELIALAYHQVEVNLPAICDVPLWKFTPAHMSMLHQRQPQRCELRGRVTWPGEK